MRRVGNITLIVLLLCSIFLSARLAYADQSSATYRVTNDQTDAGGGVATSSTYRIEGTIGPFVTGALESGAYGVTSSGGEGNPSGPAEAAPEVSTINVAYEDNGVPLSFSEGITPAIGTTTVFIYGTVVDSNGAGTVTDVDTSFYRNGAGGGCSPNMFDCYVPTGSCSVTPVTTNSAHYACRFDLSAYSDATDATGPYPDDFWHIYVTATDITSLSSSRVSDIELNSLAALSIDVSEISFGALMLGATTTASTSKTLDLYQAGNVDADVMVSSFDDLDCSGAGFVPKENLKWSITSVDYLDQSAISLTTTPTRTLLNVSRRMSGDIPVGTLFFNIGIPETGLGGVCNGTLLLNMIQVPL